MKKVETHLKKAEKNRRKAAEQLEKGNLLKSKHFGRIAEVHFRNADYYLRSMGNLPLNMAV
ncbi:MAG: hypothetical protein ACXVPN_08875 [Bacteroidia bacterium]